MSKWYIHNQQSVLENETHKLLRDFEILTDHLISARLADIVLVNKKKKKKKRKKKRTCQIVDFVISADHRIQQKKAKREMNTLTLLENLKKTMEHEYDGDTNFK